MVDVLNSFMRDLSLPFEVFIVEPEADRRVRVVITGKFADYKRDGDLARLAVLKTLYAVLPASQVANTSVSYLESWNNG
jgi:hypothetical protein